MARLEPIDVTIGGVEYRIGRLDMFDALHVERLLATIVPVIFHESIEKIAEAVAASKSEDEAQIEDKLSEIANLFLVSQPILREISAMKREDFETVIKICLSCVERKHDRGYAMLVREGMIMFNDIDQLTVLSLVFRVLSREIRPMLDALLG